MAEVEGNRTTRKDSGKQRPYAKELGREEHGLHQDISELQCEKSRDGEMVKGTY